MTEKYLVDTYALIEIIKGSSDYKKFEHEELVVTQFQLMELHYYLLRTFGLKIAEEMINNWEEFLQPVTMLQIKLAMQFKLQQKKKKLSYVDCIGYAFAKYHGIKFLTGDEQFRDLSQVEFIK